jgi:superfamily II DNA/RNA helicase
MGSHLGISVLSCVGGTAVGNNIKKLKQSGIQIIVGTMGRVSDMINKGILSTESISLIILDMDRAESMFSMV